MKICYLLETTDLWGGVRIVFDQAGALRKRSHEVLIRALGGDHRWYPRDVAVDYVDDLSTGFDPADGPKPDVVVATFWTTVEAALNLNCDRTFHLCQGYEGDSKEYASKIQAIEDVYRIPIPKLTVGPWLSESLIERFGPGAFDIYTVGQIVDLEIFRPLPVWRRNWLSVVRPRRFRVLISGLFEASVKAIPDALRAVTLLRDKGFEVYLTRVSTVNTRDRESVIARIDEYHCRIPPRKMADIYRMNDLFVAPSLSHEGFGLPFAEALACGLPSVATAIPSHMSFDDNPDYACFVPERDPASIAEAAARIIEEKQFREHLRKRGIEVAHRNFASDPVAERLEAFFSKSSP